MKKINIKYLVVATSILLGLSSCIDEDGVFKDNGSNSIVELSLAARTSSTPYAIRSTTLELEDEYLLPVVVNFTGVDGAPNDVEVTLAIDDNIVVEYDAYDTSNEYLALPVANYELPASNKIIIPKGEKTATYTIKLKPRLFDTTKSYALGIKIVSASAGTVSSNYSAGVYTLPVKSPWQGKYSVHYEWLIRGGVELDPNKDEDVILEETDVELKTVGPGVVQALNVGDYYGGYTNFTHRLDGTIIVDVYSSSTRAVQVFSSSYDLENLTFQVEYSFISPDRYRLIETYTRTGDL